MRRKVGPGSLVVPSAGVRTNQKIAGEVDHPCGQLRIGVVAKVEVSALIAERGPVLLHVDVPRDAGVLAG